MISKQLKPRVPIRRRFLRSFALFAALYLAACLGCSTWQRRLIYFPPVFTTEQVNEMAVSERTERWNDAAGKPIGWKRLSPVRPAQGQVLIMHGNAGCAFQCGHYADAIQAAEPLDVFVVEYPGYADRPGKPTEHTLYQSSEEAFRSLLANAPIYLVGESLGTGVAAYLAGKFPERVAGVALLAPYPDLAAVGQAHMRVLPVSLILHDRFPAEKYLREYHGPVASLVAGRDVVIPERFGRRLHESYSGPKRLWEFPNGDHGTLMVQPSSLWKEIITFWTTNSSAARPDFRL
jgi:pimeloyl-ACP methyl ester carboxylesterase